MCSHASVVDVADRAVAAAATGRVVDEHREAAEARGRGLHERAARVLVGEVGGDERRRPAGGLRSRRPPRRRGRGRGPVTTTSAPSAANSTAIARPIPDVDPVTSARSPAMRIATERSALATPACRAESSQAVRRTAAGAPGKPPAIAVDHEQRR